ncbi:hypothetical protein IQ247_14350 [Plectonema cf. radiosum LEGE 06105]|uniref:Uncharacterized protein n=1 Tax=Plectonema cf. radiosum LEGE 06105 TaxID=945769 RepID=A0A8J7F0Q5_9CYAN|nr:hypothetical protein [Plectonema radiosum]MBE9213831.1 hypothetical protein [Plectonema cf. radiosum LEGE 06105]
MMSHLFVVAASRSLMVTASELEAPTTTVIRIEVTGTTVQLTIIILSFPCILISL